MLISDWIQIALFVVALVTLSPVIGFFMAAVFEGRWGWERSIYRWAGLSPDEEMDWRTYLSAVLYFNLIGFAVLFVVQISQAILPLNPQKWGSVPWDLALNTAVSFMTNTNWQSYAGETTLSYFTQSFGLGVQNFMSAATGVAVFLALVRGIRQKQSRFLGNFWVDVTRTILYVLLPLSLIFSVLLMGQGVVQNWDAAREVTTLEGAKVLIPGGPAASQVAIKQLGTNGGGFFNANSAHPFENPTPFSNFLEMLALLLLPGALVFCFGRMVNAPRQAWLIFFVMLSLWLMTLAGSLWSEYQLNPVQGVGSAWEGKEIRFGLTNSLIWSTATTAASNGSVNAMHSSLSPLAGGLAMFNMMLGEVVFGGIGSGLYGMLLFVLLTVFLSGLMVGRSPEYMGKKLEASEIQWTVVGILTPCLVILFGTAVTLGSSVALASLSSAGPHGFSEVLYAWTSAAANNGSAFAGLNANTPYWNIALALAMLIGRFVVIIPVLAVAGQLAGKKVTADAGGRFSTDSWIFAVLLVGVIFIVGALTFFPALALGPLVEHFLILQGRTF